MAAETMTVEQVEEWRAAWNRSFPGDSPIEAFRLANNDINALCDLALTALRSQAEPSLDECFAAGKGPEQMDTFREGGLPNTPEERARFEAYMRGHCWSIGEYSDDKQCYDTVLVRMLYGVWRDRGAIVSIPAALPVDDATKALFIAEHDRRWKETYAAEVDRLRAKCIEYEELEASLCPEGVGFKEFIETLIAHPPATAEVRGVLIGARTVLANHLHPDCPIFSRIDNVLAAPPEARPEGQGAAGQVRPKHDANELAEEFANELEHIFARKHTTKEVEGELRILIRNARETVADHLSAQREALERAAKVCDEQSAMRAQSALYSENEAILAATVAASCAESIRALLPSAGRVG